MFAFGGFTFVPLLLYLIKGLVGSGDGGSLTVTAPVGVICIGFYLLIVKALVPFAEVISTV